jgi:hypothetical protein
MKAKPIVLSRTAARVQGALTAHFAPMLAMDAKLDLVPLLKDITAKNLKQKAAVIWQGAKDAAEPMMTPEATAAGGAGPDDVALKLLEMLAGQAAPAEAQADAPPATDPNAAPAPAGGGGAEPSNDDGADGSAKVMALLKGKVDDATMAAVQKLLGGGAEPAAEPAAKPAAQDEETPEEKEKRLKAAKDAALKPMIDKPAMDAALDVHGKAVEARVLKTQRAIHAAVADVKPWVGELAMDELDSAEAVYRTALASMEIDVTAVHADALKPILHAQPKPGDKKPAISEMALDAAASESLAKRYPGAAKINFA